MIKAVLLDMDNTILANPDQVFAREFKQLAESFFMDLWGISDISTLIHQGMRAMYDQPHYDRTNMEILIDTLQQNTQLPIEAVEDGLNVFYEQAYPALKPCVSPIPGAAELISYLRDHDYAVVIATNPLYPEWGVIQRLQWAGLPDSDYAFITHADNMHFIKPDPSYYAEIIARIGIEPDEAVIIGDGIENDICAAKVIGIHTYYIGEDIHHPDIEHKGTIQDFHKAIQRFEQRHPYVLQPQMIEPQYIGNLGALFGLISTIKPNFWNQHPDPKEWSPIQIVCHLLESEKQIQRPRLERILTENNPFITAPKAPPGPDQYLCGRDGKTYAYEFMTERLKTIDMIQHITQEDWQRPARHSIFGNTTFLEMAHFTAQHDRLHIEQLCQTLGRCE